ncbi:hypothetical protein OY671_009111, partial [Metschnikowia pulcherrima]
ERACSTQVSLGLLDFIFRQSDSSISDLRRAVSAGKIIGIGQATIPAPGASGYDSRFASRNARGAFAAQLDDSVELQCALGPVETSIGSLTGDVLGHHPNAGIGPCPCLPGQALGAFDICFQDHSTRRFSCLAKEFCERRGGLRVYTCAHQVAGRREQAKQRHANAPLADIIGHLDFP